MAGTMSWSSGLPRSTKGKGACAAMCGGPVGPPRIMCVLRVLGVCETIALASEVGDRSRLPADSAARKEVVLGMMRVAIRWIHSPLGAARTAFMLLTAVLLGCTLHAAAWMAHFARVVVTSRLPVEVCVAVGLGVAVITVNLALLWRLRSRVFGPSLAAWALRRSVKALRGSAGRDRLR